ncbi:carbamoyltransferase N-terminal domain-containing protein [Kineosporia corallincola]|uniref:carbamoyltransferase N-terminal domain-containing protein n=1 Tax=Kineosporia corallincola TaxID=2835133 RepID=UPI0035563A86
MRIGLKLTHDGGVAAVQDGELLFSTEVEKLGNRPRYSALPSSELIIRMLADHGFTIHDVESVVVDGWDGLESSSAQLDGATVPLNGYAEPDGQDDLLAGARRDPLTLAGRTFEVTSHPHIAGHVYSALATSPLPADQASAVLVWDGGLFPRLYAADAQGRVRPLGPVGHLIGHCYAMAAHHFGPYRRAEQSTSNDDLSVAGKLMAYIALGRRDEGVYQDLAELTLEHFDGDGERAVAYRRQIRGIGSTAEPSHRFFHDYFAELRARVEARGTARDEDVLATVHEFLEDYLVTRTSAALRRHLGPGPWHLAFVGGCALNIKWNSRLRAEPGVASLWVPPFPNDAGSALGNAAIAAYLTDGTRRLDWNVRLGPALTAMPESVRQQYTAAGWTVTPCTIKELAQQLHESGEPVVLLSGRAELGPRALGGRSIVATATDPAMKDTLNQVKKREPYRPVAPICLEEYAPDIFSPGTPDPYMLFDHDVRAEWLGRIPAVVHLDGTARLQTVPADADPVLRSLLEAYHAISGVPVLCNTSANLNGSGFFPDVASALDWGRIPAVWSDGQLWTRDDTKQAAGAQ